MISHISQFAESVVIIGWQLRPSNLYDLAFEYEFSADSLAAFEVYSCSSVRYYIRISAVP